MLGKELRVMMLVLALVAIWFIAFIGRPFVAFFLGLPISLGVLMVTVDLILEIFFPHIIKKIIDADKERIRENQYEIYLKLKEKFEKHAT